MPFLRTRYGETVQIALVTGASSGIGLETARALAERGFAVRLVGRNRERTAEAERVISAAGRDVVALRSDFSSLAQVRELAAEILERDEPLHVLVNNAGVWHRDRKASADGFEDTFAVNHLAPFLLTHLLLPRLLESGPNERRIVHVSSRLHEQAGLTGRAGQIVYAASVLGVPLRMSGAGLALDDLAYTRDFRGLEAYARSKLAQILFSNELARRLEGTGVTSNAVHPGSVNTNVTRDNRLLLLASRLVSPLLKSPSEGAATSVHVCCSPEVAGVTGQYFSESAQKLAAPVARDAEVARQLWHISLAMVGLNAEQLASVVR